MTTEVRGLPEPVRRELRRERVEERRAEARAARVTAPVGADEDDRADDGIAPFEVDAGELVERAELVPHGRPTRLGHRCRDQRHASAAVGPAHEQHLAGKRLQPAAHGAGQPAVGDRVPPPGPTHLDEEPARPLGRGRRRAAPPPRAMLPEQVARLAHAGSLSASSRAEGRIDPELGREGPVLGERLRRVAAGPRDGAQEDVLRRVLELDELEHLHVVADRTEQLGARGVGDLGGEALPQRAVPEQRPERRALELAEELVLAARHGEDHRRTGPHGAVERVVGGGVAGVQADDEVDAGERLVPGDVADLEAQARRRRAAAPAPRSGRRRRP